MFQKRSVRRDHFLNAGGISAFYLPWGVPQYRVCGTSAKYKSVRTIPARLFIDAFEFEKCYLFIVMFSQLESRGYFY